MSPFAIIVHASGHYKRKRGKVHLDMMEDLLAGASALGLKLTAAQVEQFEAYYVALVDWNQRMNLTAITAYPDVQRKHFLDSLTVLLIPDALPEGARVIDVGTGAGFPGLPLRLVRPDLQLTLLDSVGKRTTFLRHLVQMLGLAGVEVVTARAEDLGQEPHHRQRYDLSLARAVAPLSILIELCLPFCRLGGLFVALKKGAVAAELRAAERAERMLGGRRREVRPVEIPGLLEQRFLVAIHKDEPTPALYPRRPGTPAKRPL